METPLRRARRAKGWGQGSVCAKLATARRARGQQPPKESSLKRMYVEWELGRVQPTDWLAELCEVFGLSAAALGIAPGAPVGLAVVDKIGLDYPGSAADGMTALSELWSHDLREGPVPSVDVNAWSNASLSWLVKVADGGGFVGRGDYKVDESDIGGIQQMTQVFDTLDGQWGGGHARTSLVQFLKTTVSPLLQGSYAAEVGRQLFKAAAEATLLAAWMSYDAGVHGYAQRYFIQALGLAENSGDRLLSAGILDAMSHQATFLGNYREAANLAGAAITGTAADASPRSTAHFEVIKARALARLGDASACDKAMSAAVTAFEKASPNDRPDAFGYFTEQELAAELGHCNRDLGRAVDASAYATQSLIPADGGYVRSDFFATMVLADAYMDQGELEHACTTALQALRIGEKLKSARCPAYLDEFRTRLQRVGDSSVTREFMQQAAQIKLWTPAV